VPDTVTFCGGSRTFGAGSRAKSVLKENEERRKGNERRKQGGISEEEFVYRAIKRLRKPPYRGIHSVFSGFNQAYKEHFGKNPIEMTQKLAGEGKIVTRPVKGGVMLYLPRMHPSRKRASCRRYSGRRKSRREIFSTSGRMFG